MPSARACGWLTRATPRRHRTLRVQFAVVSGLMWTASFGPHADSCAGLREHQSLLAVCLPRMAVPRDRFYLPCSAHLRGSRWSGPHSRGQAATLTVEEAHVLGIGRGSSSAPLRIVPPTMWHHQRPLLCQHCGAERHCLRQHCPIANCARGLRCHQCCYMRLGMMVNIRGRRPGTAIPVGLCRAPTSKKGWMCTAGCWQRVASVRINGRQQSARIPSKASGPTFGTRCDEQYATTT